MGCQRSTAGAERARSVNWCPPGSSLHAVTRVAARLLHALAWPSARLCLRLALSLVTSKPADTTDPKIQIHPALRAPFRPAPRCSRTEHVAASSPSGWAQHETRPRLQTQSQPQPQPPSSALTLAHPFPSPHCRVSPSPDSRSSSTTTTATTSRSSSSRSSSRCRGPAGTALQPRRGLGWWRAGCHLRAAPTAGPARLASAACAQARRRSGAVRPVYVVQGRA